MLRTYLLKNRLFSISGGILVLFSLCIFCFTGFFYNSIEIVSLWVREWFGSFYLWLGLGCVLFLLGISISKYGKIRLSKDAPKFNRLSWMAMLYSAGMGSGILLRAVQEPVYMYQHPPVKANYPADITALEYTFYQWGFTAWAFYGVFALVMAYALFVGKRNMLLGESIPVFSRLKGLPFSINVLTILTTVFGLVAAIGLGTTQIEGGLSHLLSKDPGSLWVVMVLVFLICLLLFRPIQG